MNHSNIFIKKMFNGLGFCNFFLSCMAFRDDVRMPWKLFFITSAVLLLLDKSSFYSVVMRFFSSSFSDTKLTPADPSWLYLYIPISYLVICHSSNLWSQLHPQLASSWFPFMLHIDSMQIWQAHLSFKIIQCIFAAPSDIFLSAPYLHHRQCNILWRLACHIDLSQPVSHQLQESCTSTYIRVTPPQKVAIMPLDKQMSM